MDGVGTLGETFGEGGHFLRVCGFRDPSGIQEKRDREGERGGDDDDGEQEGTDRR